MDDDCRVDGVADCAFAVDGKVAFTRFEDETDHGILL